MGNPCPSNAHKARKNKKPYNDIVKVVDRKTQKVVLETSNTREASKFIGAYELYIFHCKNGHRRYRPHEKYDVYINDNLLESNGEYLHKEALVVKDVISYFSFHNKKRKLQIIEFRHNKELDDYELIVKVDDLANKYLYFVGTKPPTFKNVVSKIINKLEVI